MGLGEKNDGDFLNFSVGVSEKSKNGIPSRFESHSYCIPPAAI